MADVQFRAGVQTRRTLGDWTGARAASERLTPSLLIVVMAILALALRLYYLSRPGYLFGVTEYDDGSYLGSAIRLLHGQVPYRDFVFVQPPGITLLMSPVALVAKVTGSGWGMAIGRLLTVAASTAGVALAGVLVRHRGRLAIALTCAICAVHPEAVAAAHTILVEPWLVLLCLLGALAFFSGDQLASGRRVALAGLAFGFAGVIEAWAIVPVLVLLALTIRAPRRAGLFAATVAAGFAVPTLPFAALAPRSFYQSIIVAQIGHRMNATRIYSLYRIRLMTGLSDILHPANALVIGTTLLIVVLVLAGGALAWRQTRQVPALDCFAAATGGLMAVIFLWPPQFHYHFVGFLVPFLAISVALAVARLLRAARPPLTSPAVGATVRGSVVAVTVVALVVATVIQLSYEHSQASVSPADYAAAGRVIPPGACVLADEVSYLVVTNRLLSDDPACPLIDDGTGVNYVLSHGLNTATGASQVPAVVGLWRSAFVHAQFVWISYHASKRIPWTPSITRYFHRHFRPVPGLPPSIELYRRRP